MAEFITVVVGALIAFPGILIAGVALQGSDMDPRFRVQRALIGLALIGVGALLWYFAPSLRA